MVTYRSSDLAAYYDQMFLAGGLRDSDALYRWVLSVLSPKPNSRILDAACGQGVLLRYSLSRELVTHGMDFSPVAISMSREAAPGAWLVIADGEALPYADSVFDCVTCLGSLEHYLDPWLGAAEIRRVLQPTGKAALLLPNSYYLGDILWHVWRQGRGPSHRQAIERFAPCHEWADFLTMMGLAVVRIYAYNFCWPRSRADWRWYRHYPRKLLNLILGAFTPFNLAYSFVYVCKVAEPRPELSSKLPLALRRVQSRA